MRDNGGGKGDRRGDVPAEDRGREALNSPKAGLAEFVEIRAGDARMTLREVGGDIDLALIDGWPLTRRLPRGSSRSTACFCTAEAPGHHRGQRQRGK